MPPLPQLGKKRASKPRPNVAPPTPSPPRARSDSIPHKDLRDRLSRMRPPSPRMGASSSTAGSTTPAGPPQRPPAAQETPREDADVITNAPALGTSTSPERLDAEALEEDSDLEESDEINTDVLSADEIDMNWGEEPSWSEVEAPAPSGPTEPVGAESPSTRFSIGQRARSGSPAPEAPVGLSERTDMGEAEELDPSELSLIEERSEAHPAPTQAEELPEQTRPDGPGLRSGLASLSSAPSARPQPPSSRASSAASAAPQAQALPSDPLRSSGRLPPEEADELQAHDPTVVSAPLNAPPILDDEVAPTQVTPSPMHVEEFEEADPTAIFDPESSAPSPAPGAEPAPKPGGSGPAPQPMGSTPAPRSQSAQEAPAQDVDFDDDFASQATAVINSPFERDPVAPRLRVIEGPAAGQEHFVTGLRTTIGRGENNSVMLSDLAMSRQHFELIKNSDESMRVRDLDSANGTLLNGTPIREATLYDGDRLEVGESVLEFKDSSSPPTRSRHIVPVAAATMTGEASSPPPPEDRHTSLTAHQLDQSTQFFTRVSLFAGLLCIPLCVLLIIASTMSSSEKEAPGATEPAPPAAAAAPPSSSASEAAAAYMKGVEAARERDWEGARAHFERAVELDGSVDISAQLERIAREERALSALDEAREAAESEEPDQDQVLALISRVPRSSTYYKEAQQLTRDKRRDEISALYERAQQQFTDDELEEALASLDELLEIVPAHTSANTLRERILKRKDELAAQERARLERAAARAKEDDEPGDASGGEELVFDDPFARAKPKKRRASSGSSSLKRGYTLYERKKFGPAASFFDGRGGEGSKLAGHVRDVERSWSGGDRAAKQGAWDRAIRLYGRARAADGRLSKHHRRAISKELAQAHGERGLELLEQKEYRKARKHLSSGKRIDSSAASLGQLRRGLERAATRLYIQAANKKKSDPNKANQLCKQIMLMVPSSSPTYKKAKRLLIGG